ncbi:MAG: hypothetical protein KGL39_60150 [Patescibacteria group bacterium]|nr:hypothetical protein [Patescibacteria group bacterium]
MDYDSIFAAYYPLYVPQSEIPPSTDEEYKIGIVLANEAINHWAHYDGTMWKELFQTLQVEQDGDLVTTSASDYACPTNMAQPGGYLRLFDSNGTTQKRIKIVEPNEAQFMSDTAEYCYFTVDPKNGWTMHLNPAPVNEVVGLNMDYIYYKKPTQITKGSDMPDMSNPYFIVHRMLANRYRSSRNPYYGVAKDDAENALRIMQLENNVGTWANPWSVQDNTGSNWGW